MPFDSVRALTFDVFGTVVDYRSTIIREGAAIDPSVDWATLSDAWRKLYQPWLDRVRKGELPWTRLDDLERMALDEVLDRQSISLSEGQRQQLNGVWARLDAWPDAVPGLQRLKAQYIVCTLSNGSVRQMVGTAKHAGLAWDLILCAEIFRAYKPDRRTYLGAAELLQLQPNELMMVAAHVYDLRAARGHGLRTAFVARPLEWGPDGQAEQPEPGEFDVIARDFEDLAAELGC
jgi:2-haloacid dehalogenase